MDEVLYLPVNPAKYFGVGRFGIAKCDSMGPVLGKAMFFRNGF